MQAVLGRANVRTTLTHIRRRPGISRVELAHTLHLTKSSVSDATRSLIRVGLVRERGRVKTSTAGRKPRRLFFAADFGQIIALDLGGTTLRAAVVGLDGRVLRRVQEPADPPQLDAQLARLTRAMLADRSARRPLAVGIGVAGTVDRSRGLVLDAPAFARNDWPLAGLVRAAARQAAGAELPIALDNDVNYAALGEQWRGAAEGRANVICLSIGTGIGAGVIVDGKLYRGARGLAGEAGYLYQRSGVPADAYDTFGDLELQAAGIGITRRARGLTSSMDEPAAQGARTRTERDGAHAVFLAAEAGERGAAGVIDHAATQIGIAVGNVVSLLDPEMVVLVGGIGLGQAPRLLPAIRDVVRRIAPPVAREQVAIVAGELGDDAVLIGAACAAQELLGLR